MHSTDQKTRLLVQMVQEVSGYDRENAILWLRQQGAEGLHTLWRLHSLKLLRRARKASGKRLYRRLEIKP
jgi:hypothetical protein